MKSIKLHTALKLKNRLTGEIVRLQHVMTRENARRNDNPSKIDVAAIETVLNQTRTKLLNLKAAIAVANVPIYAALAELEETKSQISFIQSLPVRVGPEIIPTHTGQLEYAWSSYIDQERKDVMILHLQARANDLQDEIDVFNSATSISVNLD